jgi:beta-N-acetylhexosaminidase
LSTGDLHKYSVYASVDANDLLPFENAIKNNVSAIMVSHTIVNGFLDSEAKPSDVSVKLVGGLRNGFTGLIVTDEINMQGLKSYYSDDDAMYVDLFKAGNDLVLNFNSDPRVLDHMITVIENAVKSGEISEDRIDASVTRILAAKGINVVK